MFLVGIDTVRHHIDRATSILASSKEQGHNQEISEMLWNTKVRYHVHKHPPLVLILSQMNPAHFSYFLEINFNIILICIQAFLVISFLQIFLPKLCMHF
jgi:hypothetical protein